MGSKDTQGLKNVEFTKFRFKNRQRVREKTYLSLQKDLKKKNDNETLEKRQLQKNYEFTFYG